jgi:hypothetical protein
MAQSRSIAPPLILLSIEVAQICSRPKMSSGNSLNKGRPGSSKIFSAGRGGIQKIIKTRGPPCGLFHERQYQGRLMREIIGQDIAAVGGPMPATGIGKRSQTDRATWTRDPLPITAIPDDAKQNQFRYPGRIGSRNRDLEIATPRKNFSKVSGLCMTLPRMRRMPSCLNPRAVKN